MACSSRLVKGLYFDKIETYTYTIIYINLQMNVCLAAFNSSFVCREKR